VKFLYSGKAFARSVVIATTIAGVLDLLSAFLFDVMAGGSPLGVLRGIGGGIADRYFLETVPGVASVGADWVLAGIGFLLHVAIMLVMASVYMLAAARVRRINRLPPLSGAAYGVALWVVMYWVVLPWRWPTLFPTLDPPEVAMELFSHIVTVGIPIALVAKAATGWRYTSDDYD